MYEEESESGNSFLRKKTVNTVYKELKYLINKFNGEYVYFCSDTFFIWSAAEIDEFTEMYSEFKLPFWIQTHPNTIKDSYIRKMKSVGCHRISIGVEHGNDEFRSKSLDKHFRNETMVEASKIIADHDIALTINNIIGFPDETRELIFDTIELNRQCISDSVNCVAFAPFHGTRLREICLEKGYLHEDFVPGIMSIGTPLDQPQLSKEEVNGLRETFTLYCKLPKTFWPDINRAEQNDEEGRKILNDLRKFYVKEFAPKQKTHANVEDPHYRYEVMRRAEFLT
jgi:hypothetical protein